MSYLLDTNVLSELIKANVNKNVISWFNSVPENSLHISVLTIGQIRKDIDSLIGATALHYDLTLVTRNIKDYQFSQLDCINPWEFK